LGSQRYIWSSLQDLSFCLASSLILLQHHEPFTKYDSWILNVNSPSKPIWIFWCSPFSSSSSSSLLVISDWAGKEPKHRKSSLMFLKHIELHYIFLESQRVRPCWFFEFLALNLWGCRRSNMDVKPWWNLGGGKDKLKIYKTSKIEKETPNLLSFGAGLIFYIVILSIFYLKIYWNIFLKFFKIYFWY